MALGRTLFVGCVLCALAWGTAPVHAGGIHAGIRSGNFGFHYHNWDGPVRVLGAYGAVVGDTCRPRTYTRYSTPRIVYRDIRHRARVCTPRRRVVYSTCEPRYDRMTSRCTTRTPYTRCRTYRSPRIYRSYRDYDASRIVTSPRRSCGPTVVERTHRPSRVYRTHRTHRTHRVRQTHRTYTVRRTKRVERDCRPRVNRRSYHTHRPRVIHRSSRSCGPRVIHRSYSTPRIERRIHRAPRRSCAPRTHHHARIRVRR